MTFMKGNLNPPTGIYAGNDSSFNQCIQQQDPTTGNARIAVSKIMI
jgi:hypothetical protein